MSTQEIRDIYKKIQVQKFQASEHTKKVMEETIEHRLTILFGKYFAMINSEATPPKMLEDTKRDIGKMLEVMVMDSDEDVIKALTNNEIKKIYIKKMEVNK